MNQARKDRAATPMAGPVSSLGERRVSMRAVVAHGPSKSGADLSSSTGLMPTCCSAMLSARPAWPAPMTSTSCTGSPLRVEGGIQALAGQPSVTKSSRRRSSSVASPDVAAVVEGEIDIAKTQKRLRPEPQTHQTNTDNLTLLELEAGPSERLRGKSWAAPPPRTEGVVPLPWRAARRERGKRQGRSGGVSQY